MVIGVQLIEIRKEPEQLAAFDAICFNNTTGVLFDDSALRQSLLDFVVNGRGIVGIHAAAATFVQYPRHAQFPAFGQMLGASSSLAIWIRSASRARLVTR